MGKTVSAIAAVRSEAVRSAFKDGVYYVQLGENPSVVDLLAALLREVQPNGDGSGEADIVDTRTGRARLQVSRFYFVVKGRGMSGWACVTSW